MATGDKVVAARPRAETNERFDLVDFLALALTALINGESVQRALLSSPKAAAGSATGERWTGSITANPTSGADGLLRMDSAVFVGLDANGELVLKPAGTAISVAIPAGGSSQQVYAYMADVAGNTQVRRFIPATASFTEFPQAINVEATRTCNLFVRAGTLGSVVPEDVAAGITRPLLFLGIASNTGGVVTFTPGNNTLETVTQPALLPTANTGITVGGTTTTGSQSTLRELINVALYLIGQIIWKGSKTFTPSAANNFGAFLSPTVGIDGLFSAQSETTFTPITKWEDWQQNNRYIIDHQGYPGGQISIKDENWLDRSDTIHLDPSNGYVISGTAARTPTAPFAVQLQATGDTWATFVNDIPYGATITNIVIWYTSGTTANLVIGSLHVETLATVADATQVSRTVSTVAGVHTSFDVMVTPTSGHGPKLVRNTEKLLVFLSATIVGLPLNIYDIQVTYVLPPIGWSNIFATTDLLANGDAIAFMSPIAGLNQRHVQLISIGTGAVTGQTELDGVSEVYVDNDLAHMMEFMIKTGTVIDGPNAANVSVFTSLQNGDHWGLLRRIGDANWKLKMSDDANDQFIDTGVAFASNTLYRVKIDYQGTNRNSSGHPRARMWINGTLVATVTAIAAITAAPAKLLLQILASALSSGPYDIRVGRIHRVWNHLAAGDNV